jgi:hypothetical protein
MSFGPQGSAYGDGKAYKQKNTLLSCTEQAINKFYSFCSESTGIDPKSLRIGRIRSKGLIKSFGVHR